MTQTTRRSFLRGALALALVPGMPALGDADAATLAQAGAQMDRTPMTFLVSSDGELSLAGFEESVTRFDAYAVSVGELRDPHGLSFLVERIQAVRDEVHGFSWNDATGDYAMGDDNDIDTVCDYIDGLPPSEHDRLVKELEAWFASPVSPEERHSNDIVRPVDGVGMAYALFMGRDLRGVMDDLGLIEIDGASPGNDYRGIQLDWTVERANAAALALTLRECQIFCV